MISDYFHVTSFRFSDQKGFLFFSYFWCLIYFILNLRQLWHFKYFLTPTRLFFLFFFSIFGCFSSLFSALFFSNAWLTLNNLAWKCSYWSFPQQRFLWGRNFMLVPDLHDQPHLVGTPEHTSSMNYGHLFPLERGAAGSGFFPHPDSVLLSPLPFSRGFQRAEIHISRGRGWEYSEESALCWSSGK